MCAALASASVVGRHESASEGMPIWRPGVLKTYHESFAGDLELVPCKPEVGQSKLETICILVVSTRASPIPFSSRRGGGRRRGRLRLRLQAVGRKEELGTEEAGAASAPTLRAMGTSAQGAGHPEANRSMTEVIPTVGLL
uniref:Uncharacterized protein n=1 Tax=Oryza rufipogon TaxID=4529 RepID=A0A0E0PLR9_ORYRU